MISQIECRGHTAVRKYLLWDRMTAASLLLIKTARLANIHCGLIIKMRVIVHHVLGGALVIGMLQG